MIDFFNDPRLDRFDDPQVGGPQLDDEMLTVPDPKASPNKILRIFTGTVAAGVTQRFPDNITSFLRIKPEGWIVRLSAPSNVAVKSVSIRRQGGDDITGIAVPAGAGAGIEGQERVFKLPGPSDWLDIVNGGGNTLEYIVYAFAGYDMTELI